MKQTIRVFGVKDLLKVRVVCNQCGVEVAYKMSIFSGRLPESCPNCSEEWIEKLPQGIAHPPAIAHSLNLSAAIKYLSESTERSPFCLDFEINGEDQPSE